MGVIAVDTRSRRPIYEQLVESIRKNVLRGMLSPGEQLPSVRSLAGELTINPNTIQKAYVELERQGVIYSLPGRGSFISENVSVLAKSNRDKHMAVLREQLAAAHEANVTRAEVLGIINSIWEENQ